MIKKIIAGVLTVGTLFLWVNTSFAAQEFTLKNNAWTIEVTQDSIFVGTSEKNTSIIDLFKSLNIDGKNVIEDTLTVLDVRYVTPEKVDYKISEDTDIISKNSEIYILFKTAENGGLIWNNSTVDFELKNFMFSEIGTISDLEENSYNKVYDVVNVDEAIIDTPTLINDEPVEEQIIDTNILEENNTWIKDNILVISLLTLVLWGLLLFPNREKLNL